MAFKEYLSSFIAGMKGGALQSFESPAQKAQRERDEKARALGFKNAEDHAISQAGERETILAANATAQEQAERTSEGTRLRNIASDAELYSGSFSKGKGTAFDVGGLDAVMGLNRRLSKQDDGTIRPDDTPNDSDKLRSQEIGLNLNQRRRDEIEVERLKEENDNNNADRIYGLQEEDNKLAATREARIQKFTDLRMDLLGAQLEEIVEGRTKNGSITPGQATNIAQTMLINSGEIEDGDSSREAIAKVAARAHQLMNAMADPTAARSQEIQAEMLSTIRTVEEGRDDREAALDFEDADRKADQIFGSEFKKKVQEGEGEEENDQEPQEQDQDPAVPAWQDGVPDARAGDPSQDWRALAGMDPDQQVRKQTEQIDKANERFVEDIRFNMETGVPYKDWAPDLIIWFEAQGGTAPVDEDDDGLELQ